MKAPLILSAIVLAAAISAPTSTFAQDDGAAPADADGFGQATSANARAGLTGGFVSDLATNNPPGAVAADVDAARGALGSTPNPPGQSGSDN